MDFSEDWKSLWPISSVFSAPSLLSATGGGGASSNKSQDLGPLIFNPVPKSLTQLFASPSLSPLLPPPYPRLSLPRFLQTSADASSLLPSASTSVARSLGPQLSDSGASTLPHNRLQLLRCRPNSDSVLVFFPTGDNSDRVGFLLLSVQDRRLNVRGDGDHYEVKMPCHLILSKLADKCPSAVLAVLDSLVDPLQITVNFGPKQNAVL